MKSELLNNIKAFLALILIKALLALTLMLVDNTSTGKISIKNTSIEN